LQIPFTIENTRTPHLQVIKRHQTKYS